VHTKQGRSNTFPLKRSLVQALLNQELAGKKFQNIGPGKTGGRALVGRNSHEGTFTINLAHRVLNLHGPG